MMKRLKHRQNFEERPQSGGAFFLDWEKGVSQELGNMGGKSLGNRELRGASKGQRTYCRSARAGERNRMISYEEDKAVRKAILEFFTSMERNLSSYLGCQRERPSHWNLWWKVSNLLTMILRLTLRTFSNSVEVQQRSTMCFSVTI